MQLVQELTSKGRGFSEEKRLMPKTMTFTLS